MPKTPRTVSYAPSTISTHPVSEILASVSASVSEPVSSSASVSCTSVQPARSATSKPLTEGQNERDLFAKFSRFLDWEKSAHPTSSGVTPFLAESARPVYTLAPSALSSSVNPPTPGLGLSRPSSFLAPGDQRLTSCHFGAGVPQATRQPPSVALSGQRWNDSGGRSGVSLPRGDFGGRGATVALWMIPF